MTVMLTLTNLQRFQANLPAQVGGAVKATVEAFQARTQEQSRVDTGAQSISAGALSTPNVGINDYGDRASAIGELRPDVALLPAPTVPEGPNVLAAAVIQCEVPYGVINDQGGRGRAGDGWWTKAVEEQRDAFPDRVKRALNG